MDKFFCWFGLPGSVVLTALLSSFALLRAVIDPTLPHWICFAAMLLSSVGDVFLAHLEFLNKRFRSCFMIGAVFFMASHLLYALCYKIKLSVSGADGWNAGTSATVGIGVLALGLLLVLGIRRGNTKKLPLIFIYLTVILINCAAVFSYAWSAGLRSVSAVCAAAGILSFLLSDFVIGLNRAGGIHRYDALIWWLYPIGQILLIFGA